MGVCKVSPKLAQQNHYWLALEATQHKWRDWIPLVFPSPGCLLSARFAPWAAWLIDRSGHYHESRRGRRHWLPQVGAISSTWQMARGLDKCLRDPLIWQGWWASGMNRHVFEQIFQFGQLLLHLLDVVFEFFLDILYGTKPGFPSIFHISWPLKIKLALSISLDVPYDACMHDTSTMEWYVLLKNA